MKVKCTNENCSEFNKEREVEDWNGLDSLILLKKTTCPVCGQKGKIIKTEEPKTEESFSNVGFGIIHSMNPLQRKEYLKKRSTEHFKREIKPRKEYMDRKFLGKEK